MSENKTPAREPGAPTIEELEIIDMLRIGALKVVAADYVDDPAPVQHVRSDVDQVAHILTGFINATCCHKTGGYKDDPRCECREAAREIVTALTPPPQTRERG